MSLYPSLLQHFTHVFCDDFVVHLILRFNKTNIYILRTISKKPATDLMGLLFWLVGLVISAYRTWKGAQWVTKCIAGMKVSAGASQQRPIRLCTVGRRATRWGFSSFLMIVEPKEGPPAKLNGGFRAVKRQCIVNLCVFSQIPNQEEETRLLLGLPPDRIGHGTFLHSSSLASGDLVQLVRQNRTPLGKERR